MERGSPRVRAIVAAAVTAAATSIAVLTGAAPAPAIVGGIPALSAYGFAALIRLPGFDGSSQTDRGCSGTLIRPTWVLTIPQCFPDARVWADPAGTGLAVTVGGGTPDNPAGQTLRVVQMVQHPDTGVQGQGSPLALLRLERPATGVTPITRLAGRPPRADHTVLFAGWGQGHPDWHDRHAYRQGGAMTMWANWAGGGHLILKGDTAMPCGIDRGGPVFTLDAIGRPQLAGVHWLNLPLGSLPLGGACEPPGRTLAISVALYRQWINRTVATTPAPRPDPVAVHRGRLTGS